MKSLLVDDESFGEVFYFSQKKDENYRIPRVVAHEECVGHVGELLAVLVSKVDLLSVTI